MSFALGGLLAACIASSVAAQVLMKLGMSSAAVQADLAGPLTPWTLLRALLHPAVMGGIGLYGAGAVLWLLVLARMDLSKAYPFMAVGLCGTVLLGHLVFGEPLRLLRLAGVGTVVIGIALIARS